MQAPPDFTNFAGRLAYAMAGCGASPEDLRAHLDVSIQAIRKLMNGGSKKMEAGNNIEAAELLAVDPYWLATGKGEPHSARAWPFSKVHPQDWPAIPPAIRQAAEDMLVAAKGRHRHQKDGGNDRKPAPMTASDAVETDVPAALRYKGHDEVSRARSKRKSTGNADARPPRRRAEPTPDS